MSENYQRRGSAENMVGPPARQIDEAPVKPSSTQTTLTLQFESDQQARQALLELRRITHVRNHGPDNNVLNVTIHGHDLDFVRNIAQNMNADMHQLR